jgi:hypothetical protein
MSGDRYRLVYQSKNETHVSSIVLSREEVSESLDSEQQIHQIFGWTVTRNDDVLVCRRGNSERVITARRSSALDDPT